MEARLLSKRQGLLEAAMYSKSITELAYVRGGFDMLEEVLKMPQTLQDEADSPEPPTELVGRQPARSPEYDPDL